MHRTIDERGFEFFVVSRLQHPAGGPGDEVLKLFKDLQKHLNARESKPAGASQVDPSLSSGPFGCTIVMAARDGLVLAGNNEDRNHPRRLSLFSRGCDVLRRIIFGYDDAPVQGG